jgi:hypothetical protein
VNTSVTAATAAAAAAAAAAKLQIVAAGAQDNSRRGWQLWSGQLRHVREGVQPLLHVHVAQRTHQRHGGRAGCWGARSGQAAAQLHCCSWHDVQMALLPKGFISQSNCNATQCPVMHLESSNLCRLIRLCNTITTRTLHHEQMYVQFVHSFHRATNAVVQLHGSFSLVASNLTASQMFCSHCL